MPTLVASLGSQENFTTSPDGQIIYVAGNDGRLRAYDSTTGALLFNWIVGNDLSGITISRDGGYAVITEAVPNGGNMAVYRVNLDNGVVQTYQRTANWSEYTFGDVAYADDGRVLLSVNIQPGWSGWTTMVALDLATGTFTNSGTYYAGLGYVPSLTQASNAGNVLVGQLGLSSAEYFLMNGNPSVVANNGGSYANNVFGYAAGIEAFGGSGATSRVAIATGGGLHLYDGNFNYLNNLASLFPWLGNAAGLAFSQDGSVLYVIDPTYERILGISMIDYFQVANISLGDYSYLTLGMSDELILTADGLTFFVATASGVLNTVNTVIGGRTNGNDEIFGTAQNDRLSGGDGDDTISGVGGVDLMNGDAGNDIIILDADASDNRVDGGSGIDTLRVFGNQTLASLSGFEVIDLQLGASLTLTATQWTNGLSSNLVLSGTGSITVDLISGERFAPTGATLAGGAVVTFTINGHGGSEMIKAALNIASTINGDFGADQIRGSNLVDTINGGNGNDKIMALGGADVLTGGAGNDQFRFFSASDSGLSAAADRITDFTIGGDRLNFLLIDADAVAVGDQAFNFVGTAAFANTGIGQIRYQNSGADLLVQADVNGDGVADMEIILQGLNGGTLTAADFIL